MNILNLDLKLELSQYLYDNYIADWVKLFNINKEFYPYMLYTLRRKREINNMRFDFSFTSSFGNTIDNNDYNGLKYIMQHFIIPKGDYMRFIDISIHRWCSLQLVKLLLPYNTNMTLRYGPSMLASSTDVLNTLIKHKCTDIIKFFGNLTMFDNNIELIKELILIGDVPKAKNLIRSINHSF